MKIDLDVNAGAASNVARVLRRFGIYLVLLPLLFLAMVGSEVHTARYFREQDGPLLIGVGILLLVLAVRIPRLERPLPVPHRLVAPALALLTLFIAYAGWWLVFGGHPFTRDELLANFDAEIFKRGLLIAPVPAQWQSFAPALMPLHMLEIPPEAGWASGYLPVHAALRAGMDQLIGRDWTSPVLAAVALLSLGAAARRLWPSRPGLALLPLLLLAASPQFLANAMTPFAMTAHLALNLLWLALFLRNSRTGDMAAVAVGFAATGLHQIVFHPIFVLPFILELAIARRWRRAAFYAGSYLAIGLFWASYWKLALSFAGAAPEAGAASGGLPILIDRMVAILTANGIVALPLMALNLFRFAAWQHILLLPLAALAWPSIKAPDGIARPLAVGALLMLALVAILIPWQGVGWGYRYLHGFLGSFCLLAAYGWRAKAGSIDPGRRRGLVAVTTAATLFLLVPVQLWGAHRHSDPYRRASEFIGGAKADIVLVDASGTEFGDELVRNAPDVRNKPIILDIALLDDAQIRGLCDGRALPLFDRRHARHFGLPYEKSTVPQRALLDELGCTTPLPLPR